MWSTPLTPMLPDGTAQAVRLVVSEAGNPAGQSLSGQQISTLSGQQPLPLVNIQPAQTCSSAQSQAQSITERQVSHAETASLQQQSEESPLQKAIAQFHNDIEFCQAWLEAPLIKLPAKPSLMQHLTPEAVGTVLKMSKYQKNTIVQNYKLAPDSLIRFIICDYPQKGKTRDLMFAHKAKELLGIQILNGKTKQALEFLRRDVRNAISANISDEYKNRLLTACSKVRTFTEKLEKQLKDFFDKAALEIEQPYSEPEHLPVVAEEVAGDFSEDFPEDFPEDNEPSLSGSVQVQSVQDILQEDVTRLYPLLDKTQGYYVVDNLPYSQFSLPHAVREQLIPPSLKEKLSIQRCWITAKFRQIAPAKNTAIFSGLMKQAKSSPSVSVSDNRPLGIALSDTSDEVLEEQLPMNWRSDLAASQQPRYQLELKNVPQTLNNKTLALFNFHKTRPVHIITGKGQDYELNSGCGVLLQPNEGKGKGAPFWKPVTHYGRTRKTEESNPLVWDSPRPVIIPGNDPTESTMRDGEFFLTPAVVRDLVGEKNSTGEKPTVCYKSTDITRTLKKAFKEKTDKPHATNLIVCSDESNHLVAVRILQKEGQALVYIHETLKQTGAVAEAIRKTVLDAARPHFHKSTLSFLTPGFTSQKDFSSCGVFTCKTLRAFDKRPELDQWLWDQSKLQKATLHEAGKYSGRVDVELLLDHSLVPIEKMPAQLLKNYQGDEVLLTPTQLRTIVSHKKQRTLAQYLVAHQPSEALRHGFKANLSATGQRYKFLSQWQQLAMDEPATPVKNSDLIKQMLLTKETLTDSEQQLVTKFHSIIDARSIKDANEWLVRHLPEATPVSEDDWDMNCCFENFAFGAVTLPMADAQALERWLSHALAGEDDEHNQLMQTWCIYIKQSENSIYRDTPLSDVLKKLQHYIGEQQSPASSSPPIKRRSSDTEALKESPQTKRRKQQFTELTDPSGEFNSDRKQHIILERSRRAVAKDSLALLKDCLKKHPIVNARATKQMVLSRAIEEVKWLQQEERKQEKQYDSALEKNQTLLTRLKKLKQELGVR